MTLSKKWLVAPLVACALLLSADANQAKAQFGIHIGGGHGLTHFRHGGHVVRRPLHGIAHRYVSPIHTMGRTTLHRSYNYGYPSVNYGYSGVRYSGYGNQLHGHVGTHLQYQPPRVIHHGNHHDVVPGHVDVHYGSHH